MYDEQNQLIAEVRELRCQALEHPATVAQRRRQEWLLEYAWDAKALTPEAAGARVTGRWLAFVPSANHPLVRTLRERGAEACVCVLPGTKFDRDGLTFKVPAQSPADFTKLLEQYTSQFPSGFYLSLAFGSMALSLYLHMKKREHDALFVGQWAPAFLLIGMYNKLVKVEGSD